MSTSSVSLFKYFGYVDLGPVDCNLVEDPVGGCSSFHQENVYTKFWNGVATRLYVHSGNSVRRHRQLCAPSTLCAVNSGCNSVRRIRQHLTDPSHHDAAPRPKRPRKPTSHHPVELRRGKRRERGEAVLVELILQYLSATYCAG